MDWDLIKDFNPTGMTLSRECPICDKKDHTEQTLLTPQGVGIIIQLLYCHECTGVFTTSYDAASLEIIPTNQVWIQKKA